MKFTPEQLAQLGQLLPTIARTSENLVANMRPRSSVRMPASTMLTPTGRNVQKLAFARGGFDNSALTERGIRGIFYDALENQFDETWASAVGIMIPSDTLVEKHRWLGQTPGMREWVGGLLARGLLDFEIQIENKDFEATVEISTHDMELDKTGHVVLRIQDLATRPNAHWEELLVALIEANPTAYDSQAFFSASHSSGDSGTLSNLLTNADLPALNVTTATRPTREEASDILVQAAAHMFSFKDDKGKKANQGARSFLVVAPPNMAPGFEQAISQSLYATGGSNRLGGLGWQFDVVAEPELSSTTVCYFHRVDAAASRPYILQSLKEPTLDIIGMDSEHRKKNNSVIYSAKASRNVGPGEWRQALHLTLS